MRLAGPCTAAVITPALRGTRYAGQSHGGWGHWNNVHRMYHELAWFDEHLAR